MATEEAINQATPNAQAETARRLRRLLLAGIVLVAMALLVVRTPWAWEYRLRHMDLDTLTLVAVEHRQDPRVLYHLGTSLYNAGQLPQAYGILKRALDLRPDDPQIALALGLTLMAGNRVMAAHEVLQKAVKLAPQSAEAHYGLGILYYYHFDGAYSRAGDAFEKVCRLQPWNAEAWYYLGTCRESMGDYTRAISALGEVVRLRPFSAQALRELAFVLTRDGQYQAAEPYIQRALQVAPDDPFCHYVLAYLASTRSQDARDMELAEREAKRSIELGFTGSEPFEVLGRAAFNRQDYQKARAYYELCVTLAPRYTEAIYRLSLVHQRLGNADQAKQYRARFQELGRVISGIRNTIDRIKLDPNNPELRLRLARWFVENGDHARAVNQYEYCLSLDPDNQTAQRELQALRRRVEEQTPESVKPDDAPHPPTPR